MLTLPPIEQEMVLPSTGLPPGGRGRCCDQHSQLTGGPTVGSEAVEIHWVGQQSCSFTLLYICQVQYNVLELVSVQFSVVECILLAMCAPPYFEVCIVA